LSGLGFGASFIGLFMATSSCPECSLPVSTGIETCPECGFPFELAIPVSIPSAVVKLPPKRTFARWLGSVVRESVAILIAVVVHLSWLARWAFASAVTTTLLLTDQCQRRLLQADTTNRDAQSALTKPHVANQTVAYWQRAAAHAKAQLVPRNKVHRRRLVSGFVSGFVLLAILALSLSARGRHHRPVAVARKEFSLPVLLVDFSAPKPVGRQGMLTVQYERSANDAPMQLSIAEDTPSGASAQLRASIWQAVMVAALRRNDNMAGVRASFATQGRIDGPSAGGVCCLAMLSVMDGRELPTDFAFTGSILPDGTIGMVGGLVEKIHAASQAGKRRVVLPEFARIENDLNTGASVDLVRLCSSLNVERIAVSTIDEAYARIHRLPSLAPAPEDRQALDLPTAMEDFLLRDTNELIAEGDKLLIAVPQQERTALESDPVFALFRKSREQAESAKRAGHLCVANDHAMIWRDALRTRARNDASTIFKNFKTFTELQQTVSNRVDSLLNAYPDPTQGIHARLPGVSVIAAQFVVDYPIAECDRILFSPFRQHFESTVAAASAPKTQSKAARDQELEQLASATTWYLFFAYAQSASTEDYHDQVYRFAKLLPSNPSARNSIELIDRLFAMALAACRDSFQQSIAAQAREVGAPAEQLAEAVGLYDHLVRTFQIADTRAELMRPVKVAGGTAKQGNEFNSLASALASADALAYGSGVNARWTELGPKLDPEGQWIGYERPDLLDVMIRNARAGAIEQIGRCRSASIPCPTAITAFQAAEYARAQTDTDQVADCLVPYWQAALRAQVLRMAFSD